MARKFEKNNKDLINLSVVDSRSVWDKRNGKYKLKKGLNIFGKVEKGLTSIISTTNLNGTNHKFVDDFFNLPKNCKNKVTDMFCNKNKKVVYLIKK